jgi:hypothetical protein
MDPYIGITDFTKIGQVIKMLKTFNNRLPIASKRRLAVGVMMSRKTLRNLPTKWQEAFPPKENVQKIFCSVSTYNCLHYADYDQSTSDSEVAGDICEALSWGGIGIDALQLDMIWPSPGSISQGIHDSRKKVEVILQIGAKALERVDNNPSALVDKLADYQNVIRRVLLDKSMGRGLALDPEELLPYIIAIKEAYPQLGIGVAGGLGPETVHLISPLVKLFPDLSIDAQSRLRPTCNALDPIDWDMAANYLVKALRILS